MVSTDTVYIFFFFFLITDFDKLFAIKILLRNCRCATWKHFAPIQYAENFLIYILITFALIFVQYHVDSMGRWPTIENLP